MIDMTCMGKIIITFSSSVARIASSYIRKASYGMEMRRSLPARCLYILQPKYVLLSAIGFYHLLLVFCSPLGPLSPGIHKDLSHTLHWGFNLITHTVKERVLPAMQSIGLSHFQIVFF